MVALVGAALLVAGFDRLPDAHTGSTVTDEQLWQEIAGLAQLPTPAQPYGAWLKNIAQRRAALRERIRLYHTLYPGGAHRDESVRLELGALFELDTLRGGTFALLCQRAAEILRGPSGPAAAEEAAYWQTVCQPQLVGPTATQPASTSADSGYEVRLAACRRMLQDFPRCRYTPRLASLAFDAAAQRGETATMLDIAARLRAVQPDHAVSAALEAECRRLTAVGQPFWPALRALDGRVLDQGTFLGHPVLIVVWAGYDDAARRCAAAIEQWRASSADVRVIGIGLDERPEQTSAAAHELGLDWPQCNDGLGWGGEFVRTWGIRHIPFVFALDRAGRLEDGAGRWPSGDSATEPAAALPEIVDCP